MTVLLLGCGRSCVRASEASRALVVMVWTCAHFLRKIDPRCLRRERVAWCGSAAQSRVCHAKTLWLATAPAPPGEHGTPSSPPARWSWWWWCWWWRRFGYTQPLHVSSLPLFPPVKLASSRKVVGIAGVLQTYRESLFRVQLSGPTLFAPVISQAAAMAASTMTKDPSAQHYTILLLITDGASEYVGALGTKKNYVRGRFQFTRLACRVLSAQELVRAGRIHKRISFFSGDALA